MIEQRRYETRGALPSIIGSSVVSLLAVAAAVALAVALALMGAFG